MLLDRWLPPGARRLERHAIGSRAEPGSALAALAAVRLREVPVARALLAMRGIAFRPEMTIREFFGTSPFLVLDEEPRREVVFGVVGPFWRLGRGTRSPRVPGTPGEFRRAASEGRMAAVGNLRAEPAAAGSLVSTETWVSTPDRSQAIAFTAYWLLVGPFSAWIRRLMLRAGRAAAADGRRVRDG